VAHSPTFFEKMVLVCDSDVARTFAAKMDMEDMPLNVPKQVTKHYR